MQGYVAICDSRATQHYAINDYADGHRVVRRATVHGDVPVSIDGRQGVLVRGAGAMLRECGAALGTVRPRRGPRAG